MISPLRIGGWEKFSTVDWPGRLTATIFCQGCGWRCRYCHNAHLIPFLGGAQIAWADIETWLAGRRGLLDAVVFSGGEPTLQPGLPKAMAAARALGFEVGLHTGGPVPEALARVLPLADWVGFDFKAPWAEYAKVTGRFAGEAARASLNLVTESGVAFEVRTTWHPALLSAADLETMADLLVAQEIYAWTVQTFRPEGCGDVELVACPHVADLELPEGLTLRRDIAVGLR